MSVINLGKQGETNVRQVQLDVSRLVTLFGPGTVQLLHRRPGDVMPYPVALTRTGDVVTWAITAADTAYSGEGQAELQYFAGDSLAKSETYTTTITASQGDAGATPPEPQAGWVTQVLQAGTDAAEAADRAENAVLHPPIIGENGNWWLWSFSDEVYVDSGTAAEGPQGPVGPAGADGETGPVGPQGPPGPAGSDADVTAENIEAALGFAPADSGAVTKELSRLSNEKVDQNQGAENVGKILAVGTDGNLVLIPMPEGGASGDVIGTLDESNNILLTGDLADGTYSIKYEMEDGSIVNIGSLVVSGIAYYSVTNNLTNCTNSNSATQAVKGESYSATITANSGYELSSVEVTMGGNPVAVSGGVISIAEVTGNIVITAVAKAVAIVNQIPLSINADGTLFNDGQGWQTGYRLSISSGGVTANSGTEVTGFIPVKYGDTIYSRGVVADKNDGKQTIVWYDASFTRLGGGYTGLVLDAPNGEIASFTFDSAINDTITAALAYMRITAGVIDNNSVITVNQPLTEDTVVE